MTSPTPQQLAQSGTLDELYSQLSPIRMGAGWAKPTPSLWAEPRCSISTTSPWSLTTSWTATAPEAVRTRRTNRELTRPRLPSHPILSDQISTPRPENRLVSVSAARDSRRGVMSQV